MSLLYYAINNEFGSTCIWEMIEDIDFYTDRMEIDSSAVPNFTGKRLQEWLATRYLAWLVDGISAHDIQKDEFDKPHTLKGNVHLSISHSQEYAAYASHHQPIGVDLQVNDDRFAKIYRKYTIPEECALLPNTLSDEEKYHYLWTIKEAAFKLHGRKNLPYKTAILVEKSEWKDNHLHTQGRLMADEQIMPFRCRSIRVSTFICTNCVYT